MAILIANPKARLIYKPVEFGCMVDEEICHPVLCVVVGDGENMDEDMIRVCEEEEIQATVEKMEEKR